MKTKSSYFLMVFVFISLSACDTGKRLQPQSPTTEPPTKDAQDPQPDSEADTSAPTPTYSEESENVPPLPEVVVPDSLPPSSDESPLNEDNNKACTQKE